MDFLFSYVDSIVFYTKDYLLLSIILYFTFQFLYASICVPGLFIFICFSGYLFGIIYGFIISILSLSLGNLVFFILCKFFLKKYFYKYYKNYSSNIDKYISNSSFEYLIIFRMIPGPPLMIQNTILSLLNISFLKFLISTIIGFSPLVFLTVYVGNKIKDVQLIKNFTFTDVINFEFLALIIIIIILLIIRIAYKKNK